ncbi:MAG: hypothetical protein ACP5HU_05300 [Phycisphaerae bacterium]
MHRVLIAAIAFASVAHMAAGQDNLLRWFDPEGFGRDATAVSYNVEHDCSRGVSEQDAEMGWTTHSMRVLSPLWSDEVNELSMTAGLDAWDMDTGAILPDTGEGFPTHLWDVSVGANYRRLLDEGRLLGLRVEVGSPSDKPFASDEEVSVDATGFYRLPAGDNSAWVFLLNYSNTREFCRHVPLPGFGWHWQGGENFELLAGAPLASVRWRPAGMEAVELTASYLMPRTVHGRVGYRLLEQLELYAAFDWSSERFLRHDRGDNDDRLYFYSKQVRGGAVWRIGRNLSLEGFAGYAFDRFWFEGEEYDDRDRNRIDVSDGAFAGMKLSLRL